LSPVEIPAAASEPIQGQQVVNGPSGTRRSFDRGNSPPNTAHSRRLPDSAVSDGAHCAGFLNPVLQVRILPGAYVSDRWTGAYRAAGTVEPDDRSTATPA